MTQTPMNWISSRSMQVDDIGESWSRFRFEDNRETTEGLTKINEPEVATTIEQNFSRVTHQHQRIHSLILGARQVQDNGSISGQTFPYLPKAPSLFRDTSVEESLAALYQPSPLQKLAFAEYTSRRVLDRRPTFHNQAVARYAKMPHAVSVAQMGFQALILCGPGIGLNTFTSVPQEYPKALVPIANRPMIWYVLDWCCRMGVTDITIITPPTSKAPIETALGVNPDLTSIPWPGKKPDLLAPVDLEFNTPTAELLRLPEVQKVIKSDFLLLPCDLICDIPGDALLETYLTSMAGIAGTGADAISQPKLRSRTKFPLGGEASGRRGGLSIWYNTVNREESVKKEECDFMGTVPLDSQHETPVQRISDLPNGRLRKLVWTVPMSELLEEAEENKAWKIRQSLLRRYGAVKCMTQYRDSHIYFFPHWIKDFAMQNEEFESVSEDLVGAWAKSEWRKSSYRSQLGASKIFSKGRSASISEVSYQNRTEVDIDDQIDLLSLSSTQITQHGPRVTQTKPSQPIHFASRVGIDPEDSMISTTTDESSDQEGSNEDNDFAESAAVPFLPPVLSYLIPSAPSAPLVRRVDSTPLLLSVSLLLAKLPALDQDGSTPFSHASKIHQTSQPARDVRVSVSTVDSVVASNTILSLHCTIKQSCIGSNCHIGQGARIQGCVIMDGAHIGDKAVLSGTVIGKKARVEKGVVLKDCQVQDEKIVPEGTDAKNETFLVGGLEDSGDMEDDDFDED